MDRDTKNSVGDAQLGYLGRAGDALDKGFTNETPTGPNRFKEETTYETSLEGRVEGDPKVNFYDDAEFVDPENTDVAEGFIERPGTGWKADVKRN